jgi:hypothetical protein
MSIHRLMPALAMALGAALLAVAPAAHARKASTGAVQAELRAGTGWGAGQSATTLGAAIGYETRLAPEVFGGVEESLERSTGSGARTRFATSARVGLALPVLPRIYAVGGVHYGPGRTQYSYGAGLQPQLGPFFGRLEYRRMSAALPGQGSANTVSAGVGLRF